MDRGGKERERERERDSASRVHRLEREVALLALLLFPRRPSLKDILSVGETVARPDIFRWEMLSFNLQNSDPCVLPYNPSFHPLYFHYLHRFSTSWRFQWNRILLHASSFNDFSFSFEKMSLGSEVVNSIWKGLTFGYFINLFSTLWRHFFFSLSWSTIIKIN